MKEYTVPRKEYEDLTEQALLGRLFTSCLAKFDSIVIDKDRNLEDGKLVETFSFMGIVNVKVSATTRANSNALADGLRELGEQ